MEKFVHIQFPDGKEKKYEKGIQLSEIASSISQSLRKKTVVGKVDGKLVDLSYRIERDASVSLLTTNSEEALEVLRRSTVLVLAQAVKRCYFNVKLGTGSVLDNGYYYDFQIHQSIPLDELKKIEAEMENIIQEKLEFKRKVLSYEEAVQLFKERGELYKLEEIQELPKDGEITLYKQGEFIDVSHGPQLPHTGFIKAFKLTHISGAYWRGDNQNQVLQRVYGTAFHKRSELESHLLFLEEASKRDHRKLGKQLELFMFSEEAPGMPFYLPNGQIIRNELETFLRELQDKAGYKEVRTPLMMNQRLWEETGHWDHYHENMYFSEVDGISFAMKPMNCPGHMLVFKNSLYSYRDLPLRMAEFGQVHRHEFSGALNGLFRVRSFCQDDAHIFVREDQIEDEIKQLFHLIDQVYNTLGFSYTVELSTRPDHSLGEDHLWEIAEKALIHVLKDLNINYQLNTGDGAFYGPKIDFHIKDALNRSHQCATIQLDFQMPNKFDLSYVNENNEKIRPVVIHRAIFGSIDRFLGILIEHFAGAFPVWLAPVQAQILPISEVHLEYCFYIQARLEALGIRVGIDNRNEKLGYKIREAQLKKIPFMLVLGDKEMENRTVNVRHYSEQQSTSWKLGRFVDHICEKVMKRL
ncbi:threonine--tRNA ligase [Virgibacillus salexigens]|uniref:threonine--tRNA ligase n=1 Tax=Virgibacillus salexigens TaxID=61016 RepID=UPI00190A0BEF|nr:threonine--tRNA ligase [Virgibacillus salexigens]